MLPRLIKPHPYTNQWVVSVARGPVIYSVEDVDHPWVKDYFKVSKEQSHLRYDIFI
jgi:hypothetical protein